MKLLSLLLFFTVVTSFSANAGCQEPGEKTERETEFESVLGIWERRGYGDVFKIEADHAVWYNYARGGCVVAAEWNLTELAGQIMDVEVLSESTFQATSPRAPAFPVVFDRRESLPETCASMSSSTPVSVFDFLWHNVNDYYAFFAERDIDWLSRYDAFRSRVDDNMDNPALWRLLTELLSGIDDYHVNLYSSDAEFSPGVPRGFIKTLLQAFESQTESNDFGVYVNTMFLRYMDILLNRYLDDNSVQVEGLEWPGKMLWGTMRKDIGYLQVLSMEGYSNRKDATAQADVEAVKSVMERVFNDLKDTSAMIIDVRFNGGGDDGVAMAIANFFADQQRLAMQRTARSYAGETPTQYLYFEPAEFVYRKPVVLIAGPDTASAAEVFVLAMRNLAQVQVIGEATQGTLSEMLEKILPNGWRVTLSNQLYRDPNGINYEVAGIPPQLAVTVFSMQDFEIGANTALDKALEMLGYSSESPELH